MFRTRASGWVAAVLLQGVLVGAPAVGDGVAPGRPWPPPRPDAAAPVERPWPPPRPLGDAVGAAPAAAGEKPGGNILW